MASSLSAKARQLERNMITDKVGHLLEKRANLQDLESRDILHTGTAPAIQATQKKVPYCPPSGTQSNVGWMIRLRLTSKDCC